MYSIKGENPNNGDKIRIFSVSNVLKWCTFIYSSLSKYLLTLSSNKHNIVGWGFRFRCAHTLFKCLNSRFLFVIAQQPFYDTFHLRSWDSSRWLARLKLRLCNVVVSALWYRTIRFVGLALRFRNVVVSVSWHRTIRFVGLALRFRNAMVSVSWDKSLRLAR